MDTTRGAKLDLRIAQGKTFQRTLRVGGKPFIYKAITGISQAAPARIASPSHVIPDGWPVAVVSVGGMREINAENDPPKAKEYHQATVVDSSHVDLNEVNAAGFSPYTSGGYLQFFTPTDLTGAQVRMTIRDAIGGTALVTLDSSGHGITLDTAKSSISIVITATATAALTWTRAVYDCEIQFVDGTVKPLSYGSVTVEDEVTT